MIRFSRAIAVFRDNFADASLSGTGHFLARRYFLDRSLPYFFFRFAFLGAKSAVFQATGCIIRVSPPVSRVFLYFAPLNFSFMQGTFFAPLRLIFKGRPPHRCALDPRGFPRPRALPGAPAPARPPLAGFLQPIHIDSIYTIFVHVSGDIIPLNESNHFLPHKPRLSS